MNQYSGKAFSILHLYERGYFWEARENLVQSDETAPLVLRIESLGMKIHLANGRVSSTSENIEANHALNRFVIEQVMIEPENVVLIGHLRYFIDLIPGYTEKREFQIFIKLCKTDTLMEEIMQVNAVNEGTVL